MIIGEVQDWLERYLEVESLFFEEPPGFQMPEGFPYKVFSIPEAEDAAKELRRVWGLGDGPIENLSEVLEEHNLKVGLVEGDERFDALTLLADHKSPIIAIRRGFPGDRHRLNLAHELGHILMDCDDSVDPEKAAFRFAGALLVPAKAAVWELVRHRRNIDLIELHSLKHKYGISMQAWIYRAKDLEIITEHVAARHFKKFSQKGGVQRAVAPTSTEEPGRMKRLVMQALAENQISRSRAGELLGEPLAKFWEEEAASMAGPPKPHIIDASVLIDLEHGRVIRELFLLHHGLDCAGCGDCGGDGAWTSANWPRSNGISTATGRSPGSWTLAANL